jgi:3-oxoadipate enol-lactonase
MRRWLRFRRRFRQPVAPTWLPPALIRNVPGRGEIFYRHHIGGEAGAPTLVLLHGWTASADLQWFTAYQALGARYPFIAMDVRGHGRGLRSELPFTLEDAADDAAALVRDLGLDHVVVLGYSMGGPLSLLTAQRHPELVSGLVLVATALEFNSGTERFQWWMLSILEGFFRSRLWKRVAWKSFDRLGRRRPDLAPWLPWLAAESHRGDPTALTQAGRALRHYDARGFARSIDRPAGVLVTTEDTMVRPVKQRALAAALDARVTDIAGDHFVCWGKADEFAVALRAVVDDVVSRSTSEAAPLGRAVPTGARQPL